MLATPTKQTDHDYNSTSAPTFSLEDTLEQLKQLRCINFPLIAKSVRGYISCFNGIDLDGYEVNSKFLLNFISNGREECSSQILSPMPMSWPSDFDTLMDRIRQLDLHIINSDFQDKPVRWMLNMGLTQKPKCQNCNKLMTTKCEYLTFIWKCDNTVNCSIYVIPILKGTFFNEFQNVSLDKILYCLYYWSTCTPPSQLWSVLQLDPLILNSVWRKLQNICRVAIERAYPRYRLSNIIPLVDDKNSDFQLIQLISIKVNDMYVVCAKHPNSNMVRLGLQIPSVSSYDFADLTESWFAHGTCIRVCEPKFLSLRDKRSDLKVEIVTRADMVGKQGQFDEKSAFGYLMTQLALVLKDYNSDSLSCEQLKLLLAEIQWRELYGPSPINAFDCIVKHIVAYGEASKTYRELPRKTEQSYEENDEYLTNEFIWAEEYFYAEIELKTGKKAKNSNQQECINQQGTIQKPLVRIKCHYCDFMFDTYDFGLHAIMHTEESRAKTKQINEFNEVECHHCFKSYYLDDFTAHSSLVRDCKHPEPYCCRICCFQYPDRSSYLQHMRRNHFEHECPYRCPNCDYASSFQQDVMIHFREEHSHEMTILCPLCLKGITVEEPESLNSEQMREVSVLVHDHMSNHYASRRNFTCDKCCLSFVKQKRLFRHRQRHHNPIEILDNDKVYIDPFKVGEHDGKWAVKALRMECFIANKQPNIRSDRPEDYYSKEQHEDKNQEQEEDEIIWLDNENEHPSTQDVTESMITNSDIMTTGGLAPPSTNMTPSGRKKHDYLRNKNLDYDGIRRFLVGGVPLLSYSRVTNMKDNKLNSSKLIEILSKLTKADGVMPNLSVLLTPRGSPALCLECRTPVTCDHYVELIRCPHKECAYSSLCPRAVVLHKTRGHPRPDENRVMPTNLAFKLIKLNDEFESLLNEQREAQQELAEKFSLLLADQESQQNKSLQRSQEQNETEQHQKDQQPQEPQQQLVNPETQPVEIN